MTAGLLLVRARLRRDLSTASLARLFVPDEPGAQLGAAHRLVWALFADGPDRRRDFLWRKTGSGEFLILARREPSDPHNLFDVEWKEFAPALCPGQLLRFDLRANPSVAAPPFAPGKRGRRRDVVTRAISRLPNEPDPDRRSTQRAVAAREAAAEWLAAQGSAHGFAPDVTDRGLAIDDEDWLRIPRAGNGTIAFLAITFRGFLTVQDPERFLVALAHGFGAAKAFGCGMMLIRRAPS